MLDRTSDLRLGTRLLEVGAQTLVPDWREAKELLAYLYREGCQ